MVRLFKSLLCVAALSIHVGCTQSEEQNLMKAVKNYQVGGVSVEKRLQIQVSKMEKKGQVPVFSWSHEKLDPNRYEISAVISLKNKRKSTTYKWQLIRKGGQVSQKGSTWRIKPENRAAKKLMRSGA